MGEQAKVLRATLGTFPAGATAAEMAKAFRRANVERVAELLETLASLGQARRLPDGRYGV